MNDETKQTNNSDPVNAQILFHCLIEEQGTVYAFLFDREFCCSAVIDMTSRMGHGALTYHRKSVCVAPVTGELGGEVEFHEHVGNYLEHLALEAIGDTDGSELYISGTLGEIVYNTLNEMFPVVDLE